MAARSAAVLLLAGVLSVMLFAWGVVGGGCDRRADRDAGGVITVEFWTLALRGNSDLERYITERIAAFEAQRPGVKVRWVDVPFEAMDRKLISAAGAGRAPDVVNFSDKTYARFIGLGALRDVKALLPGDADARFVPGALALGKMGGKVLALPWYLTTQAVVANEAVLSEAGMSAASLPKDWRGLMKAAREFREKVGGEGKSGGKYLFSVPLGHESDLLMMMFAEGLTPLKAGADGRLRGNLTDPAVVEMVKGWVELYRDGAIPREAATQGSSHLADLYQNGRLGLINIGPNFLNRIADQAPGVFETTRVGMPITGELGRGHVAVMVLGVTTQSTHPKEAAELVWFMTSEESQEKFCAVVPILPSTSGSLNKPQFTDKAAATQQAREVLRLEAERLKRPMREPLEKTVEAGLIAARALKDAVAYTPALEGWPDMRRSFEDGIKRALTGGEDVGAVLARVNGEWDRILSASSGGATVEALPRVDREVR
ncbi:MAG: extracellular solute-binding protein [Phycisphaerales bacterium]|nr:extracellular solute-binding protein [Phycisphaerales bacterium]